jgi:hypothetical protein
MGFLDVFNGLGDATEADFVTFPSPVLSMPWSQKKDA